MKGHWSIEKYNKKLVNKIRITRSHKKKEKDKNHTQSQSRALPEMY